jgi:hypothetical protein
MGRSSSNKGITNRNANVMYAPPNTQDNTQTIRKIPGVAYGEQQDLTEQQQAAPLPKKIQLHKHNLVLQDLCHKWMHLLQHKDQVNLLHQDYLLVQA